MYFKLKYAYEAFLVDNIKLPFGLYWDCNEEQDIVGISGKCQDFFEVCDDIQDELDYDEKDLACSNLTKL